MSVVSQGRPSSVLDEERTRDIKQPRYLFCKVSRQVGGVSKLISLAPAFKSLRKMSDSVPRGDGPARFVGKGITRPRHVTTRKLPMQW